MSIKPILGGSPSRRSAWFAMALVMSAWTVTGCGQKGPLYLAPAPAATPAPAAPQPAKATAADDKTAPANAVTAPAR